MWELMTYLHSCIKVIITLAKEAILKDGIFTKRFLASSKNKVFVFLIILLPDNNEIKYNIMKSEPLIILYDALQIVHKEMISSFLY